MILEHNTRFICTRDSIRRCGNVSDKLWQIILNIALALIDFCLRWIIRSPGWHS